MNAATRLVGRSSTPRFHLQEQTLPGVVLVQRHRLGDERGSFERLFCSQELQAAGWSGSIAQINRTFTAHRGTVRGLHFQHPPHAEAKFVTCTRGTVWDVALDLRAGSPTFMRWCAVELSESNGRSVLIPPGCAHGLQTLTDNVEMLYLHSHPFAPEADSGVNPLDPMVQVLWPEPLTVVSEKDRSRPWLNAAFPGLIT